MDVADLTTANKIDTTNLANKMATFNKQIDKTLKNFVILILIIQSMGIERTI